MIALALTLLLSQTAPVAEEHLTMRLHVGGQLGFPHLFGATGRATFAFNDKPRFDLDVLWEPSAYLQSYSVGGAWRPGNTIAYVGPRLRLLQFQAPWSRGFDGASQNQLGLSLEAGVRIGLGATKRTVFSAGAQITAVPFQASNLQMLFGLSIGLSYSVWERGL